MSRRLDRCLVAQHRNQHFKHTSPPSLFSDAPTLIEAQTSSRRGKGSASARKNIVKKATSRDGVNEVLNNAPLATRGANPNLFS
jgi:hypothetical protein